VYIDNDVVLTKRLPAMGVMFITEAIRRGYGIYDHLVPKTSPDINSGFFGLLPGVDFQKELNDTILAPWKNFTDEQGLVASLFSKNEYVLVTLNEISVPYEAVPYALGEYGVHFVVLNRGYIERWNQFKLSRNIKIL
jgi:hypothetical protein